MKAVLERSPNSIPGGRLHRRIIRFTPVESVNYLVRCLVRTSLSLRLHLSFESGRQEMFSQYKLEWKRKEKNRSGKMAY